MGDFTFELAAPANELNNDDISIHRYKSIYLSLNDIMLEMCLSHKSSFGKIMIISIYIITLHSRGT